MLAIPDNHPTFVLRNTIADISKNFLNQLGLSYFQYLRCYNTGAMALLTNQTAIFDYFRDIHEQPVIFSSFKKEHQNLQKYWFFWDDSLPRDPVALVQHHFNIYHGLTLVKRYKTHYDMIAVALPSAQENIASFYINKLNAIEQFITDFECQHESLIKQICRHQILLPEAYRDRNYAKLCWSNRRIMISIDELNTYITAKELSCLELLLQNLSYKEIAKQLMISPRTVETYIVRFKERTGFTTKSQMHRAINLSVIATDN